MAQKEMFHERVACPFLAAINQMNLCCVAQAEPMNDDSLKPTIHKLYISYLYQFVSMSRRPGTIHDNLNLKNHCIKHGQMKCDFPTSNIVSELLCLIVLTK